MKPIAEEKIIREFIRSLLLENETPDIEDDFKGAVEAFFEDLEEEYTRGDMAGLYVQSKTTQFVLTPLRGKKYSDLMLQGVKDKDIKKVTKNVDMSRYGGVNIGRPEKRFKILYDKWKSSEEKQAALDKSNIKINQQTKGKIKKDTSQTTKDTNQTSQQGGIRHISVGDFDAIIKPYIHAFEIAEPRADSFKNGAAHLGGDNVNAADLALTNQAVQISKLISEQLATIIDAHKTFVEKCESSQINYKTYQVYLESNSIEIDKQLHLTSDDPESSLLSAYCSELENGVNFQHNDSDFILLIDTLNRLHVMKKILSSTDAVSNGRVFITDHNGNISTIEYDKINFNVTDDSLFYFMSTYDSIINLIEFFERKIIADNPTVEQIETTVSSSPPFVIEEIIMNKGDGTNPKIVYDNNEQKRLVFDQDFRTGTEDEDEPRTDEEKINDLLRLYDDDSKPFKAITDETKAKWNDWYTRNARHVFYAYSKTDDYGENARKVGEGMEGREDWESWSYVVGIYLNYSNDIEGRMKFYNDIEDDIEQVTGGTTIVKGDMVKKMKQLEEEVEEVIQPEVFETNAQKLNSLLGVKNTDESIPTEWKDPETANAWAYWVSSNLPAYLDAVIKELLNYSTVKEDLFDGEDLSSLRDDNQTSILAGNVISKLTVGGNTISELYENYDDDNTINYFLKTLMLKRTIEKQREGAEEKLIGIFQEDWPKATRKYVNSKPTYAGLLEFYSIVESRDKASIIFLELRDFESMEEIESDGDAADYFETEMAELNYILSELHESTMEDEIEALGETDFNVNTWNKKTDLLWNTWVYGDYDYSVAVAAISLSESDDSNLAAESEAFNVLSSDEMLEVLDKVGTVGDGTYTMDYGLFGRTGYFNYSPNLSGLIEFVLDIETTKDYEDVGKATIEILKRGELAGVEVDVSDKIYFPLDRDGAKQKRNQNGTIRIDGETININSLPDPDRISPLTGEISPHKGMDLRADQGTAVYAVVSGKVKHDDQVDDQGNLTGAGRYIVLKGDNNTGRYNYFHLEDREPEGQYEAGDKIGTVGSTGGSTGPHLHFEIRRNADNEKVDPSDFKVYKDFFEDAIFPDED